MEDDITEKYVDYLATLHRKLQFAKRPQKKDIAQHIPLSTYSQHTYALQTTSATHSHI